MAGNAALSWGVMMPRDIPGHRVVEFARRAEQLGFDEIWVVEDLGFHGGIAQAATVLAVTDRIRVGIGIVPAAARNVAFAAMEFNSLASIFPGRIIAGVGHGMPGWMRQAGAWPASPLTLLEETVTGVTALLHGDTVTSEGRYVSLTGVGLVAPTAAPPLVLAGVRGPKSLAISGRVADGTILAEPVTPEYAAEALAHIGDAPGHQLVAFCLAAVNDDADAARAQVRPTLQYVGSSDVAPHIAPMPYAQLIRDLREASASTAEFADRLPDAIIDDLSLAGTPERVRERGAQLHGAGVTSVILIPTGDDVVAELSSLARAL